MDTMSSLLADQYLVALQAHLSQSPQASLAPAGRLGRQALKLGIETLDLAQIHELALAALISPEYPGCDGDGVIRRAGSFFRQALTPLVTSSNAARQANGKMRQPQVPPNPRAAELTAAKQQLRRETVRRQAAETALTRSRQHYGQLLAKSRLMQVQLRHLSHQILQAQEEERKLISRELHDEISQILTGINVRLAALKIEATANTGNLKRKIVSTQRLVQKSVAVVHHFARELRPAMLDDLGLVPALLAFMKDFRKRTGIRVRYTGVRADRIGQLDNLKRTVLYRVGQEALTNVAKHAHASLVSVSLQTEPDAICMAVSDDGKAFDVEAVLSTRGRRRLGILGMRERTEMVGGTFAIESVPDKGTTVSVRIPLRNGAKV